MIAVLHRRLVGVLVLALGVAQAFDSGIRHAPPLVVGLVALGLAISAIAFWASSHPGVLFGAGGITMVIVTVARVISPVALPTLTLAGWFPVMAALLLGVAGRHKAEGERHKA